MRKTIDFNKKDQIQEGVVVGRQGKKYMVNVNGSFIIAGKGELTAKLGDKINVAQVNKKWTLVSLRGKSGKSLSIRGD